MNENLESVIARIVERINQLEVEVDNLRVQLKTHSHITPVIRFDHVKGIVTNE